MIVTFKNVILKFPVYSFFPGSIRTMQAGITLGTQCSQKSPPLMASMGLQCETQMLTSYIFQIKILITRKACICLSKMCKNMLKYVSENNFMV